ncbi:MAG: hypothetical protein QOG23_1144 [Blastocatellia bacterium]|jgi:hypothetical protein|nr:hypothetical protein [Blastocatellia bacterium]
MAQTLVSLLVHLVFSTKNRANLITPDIEPDLYKYISGTLRKMESPWLKIEDELRGLLKKYRVDFDERYIWR